VRGVEEVGAGKGRWARQRSQLDFVAARVGCGMDGLTIVGRIFFVILVGSSWMWLWLRRTGVGMVVLGCWMDMYEDRGRHVVIYLFVC